MPAHTVTDDLQELLQLEVKDGETQEQFAKRLFDRTTDLEDQDWQSLEPQTQAWYNAYVEACNEKKAPPIPEGLEKLITLSSTVPQETKKKGKKEAATPKPAKLAQEASAPKEERSRYLATDKITLKAEGNPFRQGTKCFNWFARIADGMTVEQAIKAGAPRNHIRWAATLGHIAIVAK